MMTFPIIEETHVNYRKKREKRAEKATIRVPKGKERCLAIVYRYYPSPTGTAQPLRRQNWSLAGGGGCV